MTDFGFGGISGSKKCVLRKTGETVEVLASYNPGEGARTQNDWVSFIDSEGNEHIREHLNIQFDFKDGDNLWQKQMEKLLEQAKSIDQWEQRRYDLVKEFVMLKGDPLSDAIAKADALIGALKGEGK